VAGPRRYQRWTNRARILTALDARPRNANRLADELDLAYQTVRHHLDVLERNDVVRSTDEEYGTVYLPSERTRHNWAVVEEVLEQVKLDAARAAAGLNVVLLVVLAGIWLRNLRTIRSKQTFGSLVFAILLLGENSLASYYYSFAPISLSAPAVRAMMYLQILETAGIAVLVYVV